MHPGDRVLVASRAADRAGFTLGDDPRSLAAALNLRVVTMRAGPCGGEVTDGRSIGLSWNPDRRARGLLLFHGIAHALLLREGWHDHTHGDVWLLTLELAVPKADCDSRDPDEISRLAHAPEHLVREWVALSARLWRSTG